MVTSPDGEVIPEEGEPEVVICLDEFGPVNLQPHPGRQWAQRGFCSHLHSLYPSEIRIAIVLDNFSPHLTTKTSPRT